MLGSGQFGSVYGAINIETKDRVAVKIVDKSKYDSRIQTLLFKNELTLLSSLKHPGIVSLISLFDQADKVDWKKIWGNLLGDLILSFFYKLFIVQEKLKTDLLSLILTNENDCLDERVTKFIVYQVKFLEQEVKKLRNQKLKLKN